MTTEELQSTAAQLRQPSGEEGIKTADWMNKGNLYFNMDTLKVVDATVNDNILEIGMGNGFFVKDILNIHPSIHYTGCDFSELMVEESEKINTEWIEKKQANFIEADAASLPFENSSFNKIFTINTIYFWENPHKVLSEINRVLQENGKFIIGIRPKHQMEKYPFTQFGFQLYSKETLSEILSQNGFKILEIIENKEPDFENNGLVFKMENVIAVCEKI